MCQEEMNNSCCMHLFFASIGEAAAAFPLSQAHLQFLLPVCSLLHLSDNELAALVFLAAHSLISWGMPLLGNFCHAVIQFQGSMSACLATSHFCNVQATLRCLVGRRLDCRLTQVKSFIGKTIRNSLWERKVIQIVPSEKTKK